MPYNISKAKIKLSLISLSVLLLCFYVYKDLNLKQSETIKIPDVVVNNIEVNRVVNGDNWLLKAPRVEHKDKKLYAKSLDIKVDTKDSKEIFILAEEGIFSRTDNNLELTSADAKMTENSKDYYLTAGNANYDSSSKIWSFSNSVRITDTKTVANAESGTFDSVSGYCVLSGNANILFK